MKKANPFYNSTAWVKLRKHKISTNPLCEFCEKRGRVVLATEVDHIIPIKIDMDKSLDEDNLQSLCHRCHMIKTKRVDERLLSGKEPLPISGSGSDGLPTDQYHPWNKSN